MEGLFITQGVNAAADHTPEEAMAAVIVLMVVDIDLLIPADWMRTIHQKSF